MFKILKVKEVLPEAKSLFSRSSIEEPLNKEINKLTKERKEIHNISYLTDRYGDITLAIIEYYTADEIEEMTNI